MAIKVFVISRVVKNVLSREKTFADYEFRVECWEDDFIVELLRWYDYKVSNMKNDKRNWGVNSLEIWRIYYEQMVRMLYYAVITLKLRGANSLKNLFRYFFEVEDEDPYRHDYDLMSAEKLLQVYFYVIKKIGKKSYKKDCENYNEIYPFVGHWDTEQMKDLYEHMQKYPIIRKNSMECGFCYKDENKVEKEEEVDETLERDIKLLQGVLDRLQNMVLPHLLESRKK